MHNWSNSDKGKVQASADHGATLGNCREGSWWGKLGAADVRRGVEQPVLSCRGRLRWRDSFPASCGEISGSCGLAYKRKVKICVGSARVL